ncbi:MAG: type II secretion system protein M [Desulfobacterales bacterium]|nr:type II secretion system protein M [Desulfobacterales bacterium]
MTGNLTSREKRVIAGGGILALVFMVVQFIYLPALDRRTDLERILSGEQDALARIRLLQREYESLSPDNTDTLGQIARRDKGFTLFSFLDRQAAGAGVKAHIDYMKPHVREITDSAFSLSVVKLKLKRIVLRDFIRFIRAVESPEMGISIASLAVTKSGKEKDYLDVTLEAETLMMAEGSQ